MVTMVKIGITKCFDCIEKYKEKAWSALSISIRSDLPFGQISKTQSEEFILNLGHGRSLPLNKKFLARNGNVPWYFVEAHKDTILWPVSTLLINPNFPFEYIKKDPKTCGFNFETWNCKPNWVLINKSLPLNFIEENANLLIRSNSDITCESLSKHPNGLKGFL